MRSFPLAAKVLAAVFLLGPEFFAQTPAQPTFSLGAELVVLHVMVRDRTGAAVSGLMADNFSISEEQRPQAVRLFAPQDTPVTVGLLIDTSGSMLAIRDRVVAAAGTFAEASNRSDEFFGLTFNERMHAALPSSAPFTSDPDALRAGFDRTIAAQGRTALYDGIAAGLDYASRGSHPRKVLVVVSDGGDNASTTTFDRVREITQASNAAIYTIALVDPVPDRDAAPQRLRRLAEATGGETFEPRAISDMPEVMRRIAHDIRDTYTIGYVPDTPHDGRFHRIHVVARAPGRRGVVVRTREGYKAPGEPSNGR